MGDSLPPQTLGTHTGIRLACCHSCVRALCRYINHTCGHRQGHGHTFATSMSTASKISMSHLQKRGKKNGTGRRGGRAPTWAALVSMASNSARPMCGTPATASASCRPMPTSAGRFPSCTRKINLRQLYRYQCQATPQCCRLMPNPTPAGCFLCSLCVTHHRTGYFNFITVAFHRTQSRRLTHACNGCILFCASSTHLAMACISQDILSMRERSALRPAQRAQAQAAPLSINVRLSCFKKNMVLTNTHLATAHLRTRDSAPARAAHTDTQPVRMCLVQASRPYTLDPGTCPPGQRYCDVLPVKHVHGLGLQTLDLKPCHLHAWDAHHDVLHIRMCLVQGLLQPPEGGVQVLQVRRQLPSNRRLQHLNCAPPHIKLSFTCTLDAHSKLQRQVLKALRKVCLQ